MDPMDPMARNACVNSSAAVETFDMPTWPSNAAGDHVALEKWCFWTPEWHLIITLLFDRMALMDSMSHLISRIIIIWFQQCRPITVGIYNIL